MAQKSAILLPARELAATQEFFVDLGFRVDLVRPADNPSVVELSGFGLTIVLDATAEGDAPTLRIAHPDRRAETELLAPNGTLIRFSGAAPLSTEPEFLELPPLVPELRVQPHGADRHGAPGRAGMRYLDLLPSRLGGRFIASWIEVADGGPIADWVHHHAIRFQMIHCHRGWVKVVYEDQGEPFVMHAGDGVLQPPGIRHRVLESSAGAAVVEVGCPAEHDTIGDHELELPTDVLDPDRLFGGQRFVRYQATDPIAEWVADGWLQRDTGIAEATNGLARTIVVTAEPSALPATIPGHHGELLFGFVLTGEATLTITNQADVITEGGNWTLPAGTEWQLSHPSTDFEFLLIEVQEQRVASPR